MARRQSSSTAALLTSGKKLPVLVLQRNGDDAALLRTLLEPSTRLDVDTVRPEGLVRTPLRWPADQRRMPLALCVAVRDRPGTVAALDQLVRHVGELPVVVVLDATSEDGPRGLGGNGRDVAAALAAVGVDSVLPSDGLTAPMLEQAVVAAVDRWDRGVLHLGEATSLVAGAQHLTA